MGKGLASPDRNPPVERPQPLADGEPARRPSTYVPRPTLAEQYHLHQHPWCSSVYVSSSASSMPLVGTTLAPSASRHETSTGVGLGLFGVPTSTGSIVTEAELLREER